MCSRPGLSRARCARQRPARSLLCRAALLLARTQPQRRTATPVLQGMLGSSVARHRLRAWQIRPRSPCRMSWQRRP